MPSAVSGSSPCSALQSAVSPKAMAARRTSPRHARRNRRQACSSVPAGSRLLSSARAASSSQSAAGLTEVSTGRIFVSPRGVDADEGRDDDGGAVLESSAACKSETSLASAATGAPGGVIDALCHVRRIRAITMRSRDRCSVWLPCSQDVESPRNRHPHASIGCMISKETEEISEKRMVAIAVAAICDVLMHVQVLVIDRQIPMCSQQQLQLKSFDSCKHLA
mmetsp:Transcript_22987/g.50283  ORF Transcript_22987/g.50283 Transcript_22987/m.50283 type:complete len:222 (-) Transcript_22987:122-787(-)